MTRTVASMSLLLLLGASAADLQAQWPNNPAGMGGSTAGIAFRPGVQMVTITWLKAGNDSTLRYRLLRAADSTTKGADVSGPLATTTFVDKTLQLGTVYFYRVQAERHAQGDSKPMVSAPQRFMLSKPVAIDLPAKKRP